MDKSALKAFLFVVSLLVIQILLVSPFDYLGKNDNTIEIPAFRYKLKMPEDYQVLKQEKKNNYSSLVISNKDESFLLYVNAFKSKNRESILRHDWAFQLDTALYKLGTPSKEDKSLLSPVIKRTYLINDSIKAYTKIIYCEQYVYLMILSDYSDSISPDEVFDVLKSSHRLGILGYIKFYFHRLLDYGFFGIFACVVTGSLLCTALFFIFIGVFAFLMALAEKPFGINDGIMVVPYLGVCIILSIVWFMFLIFPSESLDFFSGYINFWYYIASFILLFTED